MNLENMTENLRRGGTAAVTDGIPTFSSHNSSHRSKHYLELTTMEIQTLKHRIFSHELAANYKYLLLYTIFVRTDWK